MMLRICVPFLLAASLGFAAEKKAPASQAENDRLAIAATLYNGKDAVRQQVGSDLGGYFTIVQVTVTPKPGKPVTIYKDDFLLRSDKDGQKCQPFAPSQIAGKSALVISSTGRGGGIIAENPGPVWGGIPGTGTRPERMGGDSAAIGNTGESSTETTIHSGAGQKEDPLLEVLTRKGLPEKETSEPVSGLLYFSLEGKHKPKDLELRYTGESGKLSIRFR